VLGPSWWREKAYVLPWPLLLLILLLRAMLEL
jgi:hypothetical protein